MSEQGAPPTRVRRVETRQPNSVLLNSPLYHGLDNNLTDVRMKLVQKREKHVRKLIREQRRADELTAHNDAATLPPSIKNLRKPHSFARDSSIADKQTAAIQAEHLRYQLQLLQLQTQFAAESVRAMQQDIAELNKAAEAELVATYNSHVVESNRADPDLHQLLQNHKAALTLELASAESRMHATEATRLQEEAKLQHEKEQQQQRQQQPAREVSAAAAEAAATAISAAAAATTSADNDDTMADAELAPLPLNQLQQQQQQQAVVDTPVTRGDVRTMVQDGLNAAFLTFAKQQEQLIKQLLQQQQPQQQQQQQHQSKQQRSHNRRYRRNNNTADNPKQQRSQSRDRGRPNSHNRSSNRCSNSQGRPHRSNSRGRRDTRNNSRGRQPSRSNSRSCVAFVPNGQHQQHRDNAGRGDRPGYRNGSGGYRRTGNSGNDHHSRPTYH